MTLDYSLYPVPSVNKGKGTYVEHLENGKYLINICKMCKSKGMNINYENSQKTKIYVKKIRLNGLPK